MTSVTLLKCACPTCLCVISPEEAVQKDSKYYCSQACAEGHKTQKGCASKGCGC